MEWIIENWVSIVIGLFLLAAVVYAVYSLIKGRKQGKCSGGCPGCSLNGKCPHSKQ